MLKKQLEIEKGDLVLVANMGYFQDFTGNSDLWGTIKKIFPKSKYLLIEFQTLFIGFTKFRECINPNRIKRVFPKDALNVEVEGQQHELPKMR